MLPTFKTSCLRESLTTTLERLSHPNSATKTSPTSNSDLLLNSINLCIFYYSLTNLIRNSQQSLYFLSQLLELFNSHHNCFINQFVIYVLNLKIHVDIHNTSFFSIFVFHQTINTITIVDQFTLLDSILKYI